LQKYFSKLLTYANYLGIITVRKERKGFKMKNIMTRAWEIAKTTNIKIGEALKKAWNEFKNLSSKIDFTDIKSIKVWESYGKVRLYLDVDSVSSYQTKKGAVYVELVNNIWVGSIIARKYVEDFINTIQNKTALEIKKAF